MNANDGGLEMRRALNERGLQVSRIIRVRPPRVLAGAVEEFPLLASRNACSAHVRQIVDGFPIGVLGRDLRSERRQGGAQLGGRARGEVRDGAPETAREGGDVRAKGRGCQVAVEGAQGE